MNKEKVKQILLKSILKETVDLNRLHQNVTKSTTVGEAWIQMVYGLEKVLNELNDFESQYVSTVSGQKTDPDIEAAKKESRQILASAVRMMKGIEKIHKIQYRDQYGANELSTR